MRHYKIIGLVGIIILLITFAFTLDLKQISDRENLQQKVEENLFTGALIFVLTFTFIKMLFIPLTPVSILAGYLFGWALGSFLAVSAIFLSSVIMFYLSRFLGKSWVKQMLEDKFNLLKKYNKKFAKHGLLWVTFFRIVPIMNHTLLNILLGASRVKSMDFMIGTFLGSLPGIIILSNIGDNIDNLMRFIIFSIFYLILIGITTYLRYKTK